MRMVAANEVPKVTNLLSTEEPKEHPTLTEVERQDLLLEKFDLMGLEAWPEDQVEKGRSLSREYRNILRGLQDEGVGPLQDEGVKPLQDEGVKPLQDFEDEGVGPR